MVKLGCSDKMYISGFLGCYWLRKSYCIVLGENILWGIFRNVLYFDSGKVIEINIFVKCFL